MIDAGNLRYLGRQPWLEEEPHRYLSFTCLLTSLIKSPRTFVSYLACIYGETINWHYNTVTRQNSRFLYSAYMIKYAKTDIMRRVLACDLVVMISWYSLKSATQKTIAFEAIS